MATKAGTPSDLAAARTRLRELRSRPPAPPPTEVRTRRPVRRRLDEPHLELFGVDPTRFDLSDLRDLGELRDSGDLGALGLDELGTGQPPSSVPAPGEAPPAAQTVEDAAREVDEAKRQVTESRLRRLGRLTWGASAIVLVVALVITVLRAKNASAWAHSSLSQASLAAVALWLVLLGVSALTASRGHLIRMLIGGDGRLSTSYFQAWVWTLVLVWAFLYFMAVSVMEGRDALSAVTGHLDADYLLLLGGPFVALIGVQQISTAKRANGTLSKVGTTSAGAGDLVSDDSGRADLVDMQYLLFNVVALAFFFVAFARDHGKLPDLDDGLIALTSAAALAYIAKKAVANNAPGITSIVRTTGSGPLRCGDAVLITGFNFVPPGAEAEEYLDRVRVRFGSVQTSVPATDGDGAESPQDLALSVTNITATEIRVTVPDLGVTAKQQIQVVVVTAAGVETPAYPITLSPQRLDVLPPAMLTPGQPAAILLPGVPPGAVAQITIGGTDQMIVVGADGRAVIHVPRIDTEQTALVVKALDLEARLTVAVAASPRLDEAGRSGARVVLRGDFRIGQGAWRLLVDGQAIPIPPTALAETAITMAVAAIPAAVQTGRRRVAVVDPAGRLSDIRIADLGQ